ncbi:guanylyl cyclase, putative [Plasmodium sp.]|nr:guanylyl cyclase, putative [Plasmodium sp.]
MKTTGKPDYIHISEATYNLVKDDKTLIYEKKETEIKGKGIMTTYLLTSVIGLNYPFIREHVEKKDQFISELYEDDLSNNLNYDKTQNIIGYYSNKINQNNDSNINESIINNNMNTFNTIDGDTNVNTHYCEIIKLRNLKIGTAVGYQLKQKDIYNMTFLNNGLNNDTGTNFNQFIESHKDFDHIKDLRIGMNKLSISDSLYYLNENVIRNEAINEYKNKIKIKSLNTNKNFYEDGHLNDGHFIRPNNEYPNAQNVEEDDDSLLIICKNCNESYCTPNDCINDDHVYHGEQDKSSKRIIALNSEWIFLKFSDKNLEAKYRAHFYSNKSNINSIEQALIIFLVTFVMQTLISIRSVYTFFGFVLWLLFHYRTRPEVSSLLNIKWMIFFLNLLFISAACVFSIAYLWAISETDQTTSYTIWMTNDTIEFFFI